jgi:hypothetical protein
MRRASKAWPFAESAQFDVLFTSEEERLRLTSRMESELMEFAAQAEREDPSLSGGSSSSPRSLSMRELEEMEELMRADVENSARHPQLQPAGGGGGGSAAQQLSERTLVVLEQQATNIQQVVSECESKERSIAGLRAQCMALSGAREQAEGRAERAELAERKAGQREVEMSQTAAAAVSDGPPSV